MRSNCIATIVFSILAYFSSSASATVILSPVGGFDTINPSGTYVYGWEFDVISDITVDQLAFYDAGQDGLAESHEIGIWDPLGSLLVSATIGAGGGAPLDGLFRLVDVVDTFLSMGSGYIIGATNVDVDRMRVDTVSLVVGPEIEWVTSRFTDSGGVLVRPTNTGGRDAYFGPSFTITENSGNVPVPGTVALIGLGLVGLGCWRRKRA
jgi:hypothetical protein